MEARNQTQFDSAQLTLRTIKEKLQEQEQRHRLDTSGQTQKQQIKRIYSVEAQLADVMNASAKLQSELGIVEAETQAVVEAEAAAAEAVVVEAAVAAEAAEAEAN